MDKMSKEYYNEEMQCSCVECYTNRVVAILGGFMSFYMSFTYRYTEAHCPDCGDPDCPKSLSHGSACARGKN